MICIFIDIYKCLHTNIHKESGGNRARERERARERGRERERNKEREREREREREKQYRVGEWETTKKRT